MKEIIIAIDGYSGTGKSSTAKAVAEILNYNYIDTGAMYRAVTHSSLENELDFEDHELITDEAKKLEIKFPDDDHSSILLNGKLLTKELRSGEVNENVSKVAAITEVRREMVRQQQAIGKGGKVVMDGRDIGTMVFPAAELKVFMSASPEVRAERRLMELREQGISSDFDSILSNLKERDLIDSSRAEGPLKKADGALEIDTTTLTFEEQVAMIVEKARELIHED